MSQMVALVLIAFVSFIHPLYADQGHTSLGIPQPTRDPSKARIPPTPLLLEPQALARIPSGAEITLRWQAAQGAQFYHVQVASDPGFKWLVIDQRDVSQTELKVTLKPGIYFWRVYAINPEKDPGYIRSDFQVSSFELLPQEMRP